MRVFALNILIMCVFLSTTFSQSNFKVVGYVPNWVSLSNFAQNFNYSRVTHLNLAFKNINSTGDLPAMTSGESILRDSAHRNGIKFLLSIGGAGISNTVKGYYHSLITPANRSAFAKKLKDYIVANNLDGIDLDLEGDAINSDYSGFMSVLADTMHAHNKLITAALPGWNEGYGASPIANSSLAKLDFLNIMAYDFCGPTWGTPGQHSSYSLAQNSINYWKGRGLPASKCILGVPFYGYGFGSSYSSYGYTFAYIAANYPDRVYLDEAANTIYYNGIFTIIDKTNLAMQQAGGIMIWELTQDASGTNSLLRAIANTAGLTTSEKNHTEKISFNLYPNPAEEFISIECAEKNYSIEIFNSLGQIIFSGHNIPVVDVRSFQKGLYSIAVVSENKKSIRHFMVR